MNLTFENDVSSGDDIALTVERTTNAENGAETLIVTLPDGATRPIRAKRLPGNVVEIADGDRVFRVPLAHGERGTVSLAWQGQAYTFTSRVAGANRSGAGSGGKRSGVLT